MPSELSLTIEPPDDVQDVHLREGREVRLEAVGVVRARWLVAALAVAGGTVAFFWALASRESAILQFTGYTRVVTGTGLAALLGLPLLALFGTTQGKPIFWSFHPARRLTSEGLTPEHARRTRTSPGPGSGSGRSPIFKTSRAGPFASYQPAFIS